MRVRAARGVHPTGRAHAHFAAQGNVGWHATKTAATRETRRNAQRGRERDLFNVRISLHLLQALLQQLRPNAATPARMRASGSTRTTLILTTQCSARNHAGTRSARGASRGAHAQARGRGWAHPRALPWQRSAIIRERTRASGRAARSHAHARACVHAHP
jgi:hypothetical protein